MCTKDADRMANSVDLDQTRSSLIWVYTVSPDPDQTAVSQNKVSVLVIDLLKSLGVLMDFCKINCVQYLYASNSLRIKKG